DLEPRVAEAGDELADAGVAPALEGLVADGVAHDGGSLQVEGDALRSPFGIENGQLGPALRLGHLGVIFGGRVDGPVVDVSDDLVRLEAGLVGGAAGH